MSRNFSPEGEIKISAGKSYGALHVQYSLKVLGATGKRGFSRISRARRVMLKCFL